MSDKWFRTYRNIDWRIRLVLKLLRPSVSFVDVRIVG